VWNEKLGLLLSHSTQVSAYSACTWGKEEGQGVESPVLEHCRCPMQCTAVFGGRVTEQKKCVLTVQ